MALLPHNKKVYEQIISAYEANNSVLLVHGTGLGKSFIFLELAQTIFMSKKVLFVVPKHSVEEGISDYDDYKAAGIDICFKTYNYFNSENKTLEAVKTYDVFVFDEAHHLGSELYGRNAREMFDAIEYAGKKILGMTATNVREDKVNVSDYFNETVLGMSTFDAIREGLIPPFEYLVCKDNGAERAGYDRNEKDYKKVIDYYDSLPLLSETVDNNKKDRWLCFFSSIKELEGYENTIRELFTDEYTFIKITSKHDSKVSEISEHEKTVVLCVDKLLEGIHVPKTQGIILFRNVVSLPVFQQILGRVVHVGEKEPPIVIDCTRTAIKMLSKLLKEDSKKGKAVNKGSTPKPVLYCSLNNTEHFNLTRLLALASERNWSSEEEDIIKENYLSATKEDFKRLLPHRTYRAIQARALSLGILRPDVWSEDEDNIIKTSQDLSIEELAKLLPDKTKGAIQNRRQKFGVRKYEKTKNRWTKEEIDILYKYGPSMPDKELAELIPGKSFYAVKGKKKELGIKLLRKSDLTDNDIAFIRANAEKLTKTEIAKALGKSIEKISEKIHELGLKTGSYSKIFDKAMDEYLKSHYTYMSDSEIAIELNIKTTNVTSRRRILGLSKKSA